ncbi:MAG TPA: ATP-binding cassette domain-containing protein [Alphaproteobacteria bacterium]|nr:ATP-binding cassette domain-containing protein [Alphaproteobacteria bacterium]
MLLLESLNVTLGKETCLERTVLNDLCLSLKKGEFVSIIGGNGAGKSTLFNVISGFITPDKGKVFLKGSDVTKDPQHKRSAMIAKVMQDPKAGTMEHLSILENMAFAYKRGKARGLLPYNTSKRRSFFAEKLEPLGMNLENRLNDLVGSLSGGQRQALSLIMAVLTDFEVLLLDELTAALDPKVGETVMELANSVITSKNSTSLMITHNMAHALKYGGRVLVLHKGRIIKDISKEEKAFLTPVTLAHEIPTD